MRSRRSGFTASSPRSSPSLPPLVTLTSLLTLLVVVCIGLHVEVGLAEEMRQCWACRGNYDNSSCGFQFANDSDVATCNGICFTVSIAFQYVIRNCTTNTSEEAHQGCYFVDRDNETTIFQCTYTCDTDYCNGQGVLPEKNPSPPTPYVITTTPSTTTTTTTTTTTLKPVSLASRNFESVLAAVARLFAMTLLAMILFH